MTSTRNLTLGLLLVTALAAPALAGSYVGGGTFVVKAGQDTVLDNGGALCRGMEGDGVGGGCLRFPPSSAGREGGFVGVMDASAGREVAFQVCIDNNGDGVCGGQFTPDEPCRDQIFFSHADGGKFFNPLGPLPTTTLRECPNAFQGYVVLLCQGEHADPRTGSTHTHSLTQGSIFLAPGGSGYGDFCGGGIGSGTPTGFVNAAAKAYRVV